MFDLDNMKKKVLEIADHSNPYTQADFEKEFGGGISVMSPNPKDYRQSINFKNESNNQDPDYETAGASGFDLRADLASNEEIVLKFGQRAIIPTGLFFELPQNFELQIRARSGLAAKNGVTVLNGVGTIDADYRGEVKVILINFGDEDFTIKNGDRIAQGVIATVTAKNVIRLNRVKEISNNTVRGTGGFGSTGMK
jgi:dUTP pyrophosphatase